MAETKTITKSLAAAEDFALGVGTVQQNRAGQVVDVHRVHSYVPVASEALLANLDIAKFTLGAVVRDGLITYYQYTEAAGAIGISSAYGSGVWQVVLSGNADAPIYNKLYSFEKGNTLNYTKDALKSESDGEYYRWDGALPKVVPAGSTPSSAGGIGPGKWLSVGDASLSTNLYSSTAPGTSLVMHSDGYTVQQHFDSFKTVLSAELFGAKGQNTDDTAALQTALNHLESLGGGTLYVPPGTYYLSLANSSHNIACLLVPSNVRIIGAGRATKLYPLPTERGLEARILVANKNYDTIGGYDAASNIIIEHLEIGDSSAGPQRTRGDVIGFGHARNCLVQHVHFQYHDQHGVDICCCDGVKVLYCSSFNDTVGTYRVSGVVQVDSGPGGMEGIYAGTEPSINIEIAHNYFVNKSSVQGIHIGHKPHPIVFRNISIHDNTIDAGYSDNDSVIKQDPNSTFNNLSINDNTIIVNHFNAKGIDMALGTTVAGRYMNGVKVCRNHIYGTGRIGIWAGCAATSTLSAFPALNGYDISDNRISLKCTGAGGYVGGMFLIGLNLSVAANNQITLIADSLAAGSTYLAGIELGRNRGLTLNANSIEFGGVVDFVNYTIVGIGLGEYLPSTVGISGISINQTMFIGNAFKHLLYMQPGIYTEANGDRLTFSRSTLRGYPDYSSAGSHIHESFPISDGTNFRRQVTFRDGTSVKLVEASKFYPNLPLTGKKTSSAAGALSPAKVEISFAGTTAALLTDAEVPVNTRIGTGSDSVGLLINDVNQSAGTFAITTGNLGVSWTIDQTAFTAFNRTTGYIKIMTGI